jgi:hypothetical protein
MVQDVALGDVACTGLSMPHSRGASQSGVPGMAPASSSSAARIGGADGQR